MPVTIRSRLLLLVLSALLPGAAGALWLIGQTYLAERDSNQRSLRDNARALAMVVERELDQRATVACLLSLSLSQVLDGSPALAPGQLALFHQQAQRALAGRQGWIELSDGAHVLLDTRSAVSGVSGVAPSGAAPASAARAAPLPSTVQGLVSGPVFSPLQAAAGGAAHAAASCPVQRGGSTALNLSVTIVPAELQRMLDSQHLPADRSVLLLDSANTVVARHPAGSTAAGPALPAGLLPQLAGRGDGALTLAGGSVGYFSRSAQGWSAVNTMPRADFQAQLSTAVLQVSAAALLLLALAALAAVVVSRRIAGPVISLKQDAARLQAGELLRQRATGILECDQVAAALADASRSIADAHADLQRQVGEAVARTRAAEQRGAQSQRVEALGRLTGGVAHDFNNLLGVISNSAHLIERQTTDPEAQAALAATLRAVDVGSRLTQHLLRIAGLRPVRPQAVQLERLLPELGDLLRSVLGKRIVLTVSVVAGTRPVEVDLGELELALVNLALNARDALPRGGRAELHAANADAEDSEGLPAGNYVRIAFSDDGAGIAPEHAARAFEPFFTTKPAGTGTGMGLSQVHGFCVQAGGGARLGSTPGLGTTVSLLLPATSPQPALPLPALAAAGGLQGARVLLVEDNTELAGVTAALLQSYGCSVQRAADADAALRLLQDGPVPDAVLSDIVMPGSLDGVALARLLRQQHPQLPVLLMSGYSAALVNVDDFVVLDKPYPKAALLSALLAALPQAASAAAPGPAPGTAPGPAPPAVPRA